MADRTGEQLGHYRLIRLLGRGGFAEVYLGEHLHLKTQAAIKVLHTSLEEGDVEGFLREAQTVAKLKHPHIVRVFDFDIQGHTPFLVMDYLPNGNVRQLYPRGKPLPLTVIVSYVAQIASALQYAHDEKVIHRDVKPENMLLDRVNTLLLSDFGIALMAQSSRYQSTQEVAGTAAYMAPEQFQGKPHRASDQYALGVVVYEWLSGDHPFHGTFSEIASQHLFVPPAPLRERVPMISPHIEQVVLRALEKDLHRRFANVQAFAMALEQANQVATIPPVTLPAEIAKLHQPLPLDDTIAAKVSTASTPTKAPSTAHREKTFFTSNSQKTEKTATKPYPEYGTNTISHQRRRLTTSRTALLIGLLLLVLGSSTSIYYLARSNQGTPGGIITATEAHSQTATSQQNPYGGKLVLNDPLRDNSRGYKWDVADYGTGGACQFKDGAYHASVPQKDDEICFAEAPTFSNFAFQVNMVILSGDSGGIAFRAHQQIDNNDNLTQLTDYEFFIFPAGSYKFIIYRYFGTGNPQINTLSSGNSSAIHTGLNQSNLIAVVAQGSSFTLYVNNQQIASVNDSSFSSGQIAVLGEDLSNSADVAFSDAKGWQL